jgi:small subunit ribosomal protein S9
VETKTKYYWGTGRRKTAVARVRICDGNGKIEINGRALDNYFTEHRDRHQVIVPLQVMEMMGKLNVFVNVHGGGYAGQAGAISQGVARALKIMLTPASTPAPAPVAEGEEAPAPTPSPVRRLRGAGLLTRDARMKERKKYGRRGARRSFQFSKR